jgi:hypothetical protein
MPNHDGEHMVRERLQHGRKRVSYADNATTTRPNA